jgi:hypothetical protein
MSFQRSAALALIAVVAACGDSTGPEDFSPTDTDVQTAAIRSVIEGNTTVATIAVLAPFMQFGAPQLALSVAPFDPTEPSGAAAAERLQALRAAGPSFGTSGSLALFPADLLGKTLVFDPDLERYAVDESRTGAPATGVRLILYAVNPVLGQILFPLNEVGHLDLIDVSTAASDALRLVAVVEGETHLDYTASITVTTTSATLAAEGFLSDGTDQVDFDLSLTGTANAVSLDYLITHTGNSVRLQATLSGSDDDIQATLTILGDGDTVVMTVTTTPSTVSGQITYNGDVAITISGTPNAPTFARPDGTPLTEAEIDALMTLGEIVGELFDAFDNLLLPALLVFALA